MFKTNKILFLLIVVSFILGLLLSYLFPNNISKINEMVLIVRPYALLFVIIITIIAFFLRRKNRN